MRLTPVIAGSPTLNLFTATRGKRGRGRTPRQRAWSPAWLRAIGAAGILSAFLVSGLSTTAAPTPGVTPAAPLFAVKMYDIYSGLPNHAVPVLTQTRDGYLWFGTETGLARFDGAKFVTFRTSNTPELPANLIRSLWEGPDGWLWIATQAGLCRYRQGRFERVGLTGQHVSSVIQDRAGRVWIATQTQGLFEFRRGQLIDHGGDPGMPAEKDARIVFVDSHDRLWIVFRSAGVFYFDGGTFRRLDTTPYQITDFDRITESPAGTLWVGSERHGLLRVRGTEIRHLGTENGLDNQILRSVFADREGRIWVVTSSVFLLASAEATQFVRIALPNLENCRDIIEDREGSFWVGSAGDGVAQMRPSGFRMLSAEDGPFGGNTRTVVVDAQGVAWIGLASTGVARVAPDGTTTTIATGGSQVWTICSAADGNVWIGTRDALHRWHDGKIEVLPEFQRVRALFEDHAHTIWIGSETLGVTRFRNGAFTSLVSAIQDRQKLRFPPIGMAFAEGADGTVYVGLRDDGGLVSVKEDNVTVDQTLPSNDIRWIHPDPNGDLWVGTKSRGLLLRNGGHWLNPEQFSEPFNDLVSAILQDDEGRLWFGTPKGIAWAPKAQLLEVAHGHQSDKSYRLALAEDGVRPGTIGFGYYPTASKGPDGRLWFASRHGIAVVDPAQVRQNRIVPPVVVERVVIDNQTTVQTTERAIELAAGTRLLTIEYTALSFVSPSQVRFRYRLGGRDRGWVDAGTRRTALYADLPPGSYRFQVIACNDDGVWNETGASLAVIQRPYFYQTRWFYGVVAAAALGIGLGVFRWRTASLRRRNEELETRIAQRTAELAKSYETLRASEYFYHSLIESLPQIIVRKDTEGRFTYANSLYSELIGRPLDQIIGRTDAEILPRAEADKQRADDQRVMTTRETLESERVIEQNGRKRYLYVKHVPLNDGEGRSLGVQILCWDMTNLREIEEKLKQAQRELLETSRLAGIAEMATGILHNLGNALNSVNTTASLVAARVRASKVTSVHKVAELLEQQGSGLAEFIANDPRGQHLPVYLATLGRHLDAERDELMSELRALQENVEHIKELVAAQQRYARVTGVVEDLPASELVEFALRLTEASFKRENITVVRELLPAPRVRVERQKAVQIIGNLLNNARDALIESEQPLRTVIVGARCSDDRRVQIYVTDNGVGIAPENVTRIFGFGFTTKKTGHGFGLHSSALAATELGGALTVTSAGIGQGATFTLELPIAPSTSGAALVAAPASV